MAGWCKTHLETFKMEDPTRCSIEVNKLHHSSRIIDVIRFQVQFQVAKKRGRTIVTSVTQSHVSEAEPFRAEKRKVRSEASFFFIVLLHYHYMIMYFS